MTLFSFISVNMIRAFRSIGVEITKEYGAENCATQISSIRYTVNDSAMASGCCNSINLKITGKKIYWKAACSLMLYCHVVTFEVRTVVAMKVTDFWDMMPLVWVDRGSYVGK
jgi:hypothetical protein